MVDITMNVIIPVWYSTRKPSFGNHDRFELAMLCDMMNILYTKSRSVQKMSGDYQRTMACAMIGVR